MAENADSAAGDDQARDVADPKAESSTAAKKQRPGFLSRLKGMFGGSREDFEKKLRYLSKEEALVHARMKRRALSSRKTARNVIVLSVILEVAAVAYAIMTTRSLDLNWKMRAVRVLPMFLLPVISSVIYTTLVSFTRMLERKDQKTLERLRAERKAKIDELKERTNYYSTQQLIQRYDLDPAAKAAAATILASKLGADSGLRVYLGDESNSNAALGKSSDAEMVHSSGLRNRKPSHSRSHSTESAAMVPFIEEAAHGYGVDGQAASQTQRFVEHHRASGPSDGGWIARIAALLVGEDPTQCYALICGNCHMHNGLARKEDFAYITYYCPHCNALNGSRPSDELGSGSSSAKETPTAPRDGIAAVQNTISTANLETLQELPVEENNEEENTPEDN